MGGFAELGVQAGENAALWALCGAAALGALAVAARAAIAAALPDLDFDFGYDASAAAIEGARLLNA
ncbi:MAG: hypothetical protein AB7J28_03240 [Hyphomonadaceae bacterium]